jgi:Zn-dependent M28 family amino/carboxypeptidase
MEAAQVPNRRFLLLVLPLLVAACSDQAQAGRAATDPHAVITEDALRAHIRVLASDAFEGRAPSSRGEELTLAYLEEQLTAAGVQPGNRGSFRQPVPLVSITADPDIELRVRGRGGETVLRYGEDVMVWTKRVVPHVSVSNSEMVFVGYGVVAPEYGWNDYEGLDVRGKTVVMLVNDPGFATEDPALFTGRAMTYYGRWTYKLEEAARQGAEAALIVHETEPASYGWDVVRGSWAGEQFGLIAEDRNLSRVAVEGWITDSAARALFARAAQDFDGLKQAALARDFRPVSLGLNASISVRNTIRESTSHNIVGIIPGSERPDEYVIYTAHWDHLGRDGDEIFNGAVDNASGTGGLLVLARAFAALEPRPARSIVFLPVTAEEQGLLGSAHYAEHPVFPLDRTVAVINIDVLNYIGPTRDITIVGYGNSELDRYVEEVAAQFSRRVMPDQRPEAGSFYRSDHFSFAKQGVPALYPNMGRDLVDGGVERGRELADRYVAERYHKPADEYSPDQDWSGGAADLSIVFEIGRRLANTDEWPNWAEGNEFRAARDAQRAGSPSP